MGFEDADEEPVQDGRTVQGGMCRGACEELTLGPENVDGGEACQLRFVKFQNARSLELRALPKKQSSRLPGF